MPLIFSHHIDAQTRLAIWQIEEPADFFLEKVPLSRHITHAHKRLQHLAGRYLLQHLFPDLPIQLIQIADTRKPFLAGDSHHFSISHCGAFAAAIVSKNFRVGIDIELHSSRILPLRHKFISEAENLLQPTAMEVFPTLIWSAKEAMYKWYSLGEVDFLDHLQVVQLQETGISAGYLQSRFLKQEAWELEIPYRIFNSLVLTWVYC